MATKQTVLTKEGLKNFYKNYIDSLSDDIKKNVGVFWSAEEDEVIIKEDDKLLAKSKYMK